MVSTKDAMWEHTAHFFYLHVKSYSSRVLFFNNNLILRLSCAYFICCQDTETISSMYLQPLPQLSTGEKIFS